MLQQKCSLHPKFFGSSCANTLSEKLMCSPLIMSSSFSKAFQHTSSILEADMQPFKQLQHSPDVHACHI